jgi:hypothetical protein
MKLGLTRQFMRRFSSTSFGWLALIFICLKVWANKAPNINWDIALSGFSPIDWVNHHNLPQNFTNDFPQGSQSYNASLFMYVYRLADYVFEISPEKLMPGVILFEMLFMGVASVIFFRALIPKALPVAAFVFAVLVVNSGARSMELAGFGGPFFWGLYYNFSDGMRLIAVAMVLQRRFLTAALLFALSVMTHPLMGAMGGIFALGCFVSARHDVDRNKILVSSATFLLLAGGWWFYHLQNVDVVSTSIAPDIWIAFSKAFNFHFFPVDNGILTFDLERRLLPFLGLLLLAGLYVSRIQLTNQTRNGILLGGGLLLMVTLAGLGISYWSSSPGLIKLTLTRASDMLILVSLAVVVAGALSAVEKGLFFQASIASGLLFAPFLGPAFPTIYVFFAIISQLPFFRREKFTINDKVVLILLIVFSIFLITYYQLGFVHLVYQTVYWGHKYLWLLTTAVGGGVLVANVFHRYEPTIRQVLLAAVVLLLIPLTLRWAPTVNHGIDDKPLGLAYMNAQLWAKENTAPTALFMVDPTIYYGWRDFSQRSSFGNLREWLHTSWLYDSNKNNYEEGLRRTAEFGIFAPDYVRESPPLDGFSKINKEIGDRFYSYDTDRFMRISRKYNVDYIVMKKERIKNRLLLPVAYENNFFIVYRL